MAASGVERHGDRNAGFEGEDEVVGVSLDGGVGELAVLDVDADEGVVGKPALVVEVGLVPGGEEVLDARLRGQLDFESEREEAVSQSFEVGAELGAVVGEAGAGGAEGLALAGEGGQLGLGGSLSSSRLVTRSRMSSSAARMRARSVSTWARWSALGAVTAHVGSSRRS